jgi:hypothetical protein
MASVKPLAATLALALPLLADHALARDFGEEGAVHLGADRVMGVFFQRDVVITDTTQKTTSVGVLGLQGATPSSVPRLALDYFVMDSLSVGGSFMYVTHSQSQTFSPGGQPDTDSDLGSSSLLTLHPRAGYAVAFNKSWGVLPRGGLMFAHRGSTAVLDVNPDGSTTESTISSTTLALTVDGMFYVTPIDHLIFMGGPFIDLGVWGSGSVQIDGSPDTDFDAGLTAFGLAFALGGYF